MAAAVVDILSQFLRKMGEVSLESNFLLQLGFILLLFFIVQHGLLH